MISYVKLNNYKSLVNFKVDFMKSKTKAKNLVLIYGENGIGKSNFATSFYTLNETMSTMSSKEVLKKFMENSKENINELYENDFKLRFRDIEMIIKDCKTINSDDDMVLEYGFNYKGNNGVYKLVMNDTEIVSEKLVFILNKNETVFFDINEKSIKVNQNIFTDKLYYTEFCNLLAKYWGKHSFLSILSFEIEDKKAGYVKKRIINNLYNVLAFFKIICTKVKGGNHSEFGIIGTQHKIMENLNKGTISIKDEKELTKTEFLLNNFFTLLYSDIKKVYYKKEIIDNKIKYNLFVKKLIYNKIIDVNFDLESTGTQSILELIPYLISACEGFIVIIDELDTGIHDLLIKTLLESVSRYLKGQLIITTHNTLLIESDIPNEDIYVFKTDRDAFKELIAITDFNGRIQKNINPRKKYLKGMFSGVPMVSDIDFEELIYNLK
ncbi:MAG: AAA family ATPase [Clostridia bacterium]